MNNKIVLGTANFGLNYGINNFNGKISDSELIEIILLAEKTGVSIIDTAQAYGDAEKRLGIALKGIDSKLKIVTKLKPSFNGRVSELLESSKIKLGIKNFYGVLFHDFQDFIKNKNTLTELKIIKEEAGVSKIGFSVYYPEEIEFLFNNNVDIDIVQFPFSIFDRRFEYLLKELKERNVEIHTRSIFLQGLVFMNPKNLPDYLKGAKETITELLKITDKYNLTINELCLNYVLKNKFIDNTIIGVDSAMQFEQNIMDANKEYSKWTEVSSNLEGLKIEDEKIILPINWN